LSEGIRTSVAQRQAGRSRLGFILVAAFLYLAVAGLYAAFWWSLPPPRLSVVFKGSTESLAYRVVNPSMASMRIFGMRGVALDGSLNACVDGILSLHPGTRVEYRRGDESRYSITIDPQDGGTAGMFSERATGRSRELKGSVVFAAASTCGEESPTRLPVWGPLVIGEEMRPAGPTGELAPGLMTSGTLYVYGRSHERLLGLKFPSLVYLASTTELPAGSVLSVQDDQGNLAETGWTGIARILESEPGFDLAVSSDTRRVTIASRSLNGPGSAAERIDLGEFSQLLNDPNVIQLQILAGVFFFLLQIVGSTLSFVAMLRFGRPTV
jgi:hypothetical protein